MNEKDDEGSARGEEEWLRDMVDEDLRGLFSEDEHVLRQTVRRLMRGAEEDPDVESRLVDLLETSLDLTNDDTMASVWTTLILGEIGSRRSIPLLLRSLASDVDESLQDAAGVAILRIGSPAVEALLDAIEEGDIVGLAGPGYGVLSNIGVLEDEPLRRKVLDFLEERLEVERRVTGAERVLEPLARALAFLGAPKQLDLLREILAVDCRGRNGAIEDAIAMLEENPDGRPVVQSVPPWEDRYGWILREELEDARVRRGGRRRPSADEEALRGEDSADEETLRGEDSADEETLRGEDSADDDPDRALSLLYWGLNATVDPRSADQDRSEERADEDDDSEPSSDSREHLPKRR